MKQLRETTKPASSRLAVGLRHKKNTLLKNSILYYLKKVPCNSTAPKICGKHKRDFLKTTNNFLYPQIYKKYKKSSLSV